MAHSRWENGYRENFNGKLPAAGAGNEFEMALPGEAFETILQDQVKTRTLCKRRKECGTRKTNDNRSKQQNINCNVNTR